MRGLGGCGTAGVVTKTVTGQGVGTPVAVTLGNGDLTTLGQGAVSVSAVQTDPAGNASPAGTASFTLDTGVPAAPLVALGTGVGLLPAGGATAAEATQGSGVVTVAGESCLLYTSPSPRDGLLSRMPSSA